METRASSRAELIVEDPVPCMLYESGITDDVLQKEIVGPYPVGSRTSVIRELRRGTAELAVKPIILGGVSPPTFVDSVLTEGPIVALVSVICTQTSLSEEHLATMKSTLHPDYADKVYTDVLNTPGMYGYELRDVNTSFLGGMVVKKYICRVGNKLLPCISVISLSVPEEEQGTGRGKILFGICRKLLFDSFPDAPAGFVFAQTVKTAKFWTYKLDISNVGRCLILQASILNSFPETIYTGERRYECEPRGSRIERVL